MRARRTGAGVALLALIGSGLVPGELRAESGEPPALVLLISVDQLRRDRLDPGLPGGLGRLAREGQVHVEAALDHALTETCPGHVALAAGRQPGPSGVPSNGYIDVRTGERRYCVEDWAEDAAVLGLDADPSEGRSPRNLRVDTLGDWMKVADPETRVVAVSAKDRAAIALGGRHADAAYWLRRNRAPGFTTSRYYRDALPDWVAAWNAVPLASRVPAQWRHATRPLPARPKRIDDFPGESDERERVSPHPLFDADPETMADNVYASPYVDLLTLEFAERLALEEGLGRRGRPDLLAISLSGTDKVGHEYGPWSLESADALARLDAWLGEFLHALEERLGEGRLLVALSSDHGVLPLPEWLAATGELRCPVEGGRLGVVSLLAGLWWELHSELSPFAWPTPWLRVSSNQLTVDRAMARRHDVPVERVVAVAERWLEARPGVRAVWTRREIERGEGALARLYRNSFDPEKSGDLVVQLEPTCLVGLWDSGTGHGSPYGYDREVPIVFWGPGIEARRVAGPAATVDVAPSLAVRLGLSLPDDLDGHPLLAP